MLKQPIPFYQTVKGYCGHVAIKVHFIVLMFETLSTFDHHKL